MNKYQQALKKAKDTMPEIVQATNDGSYVFTSDPVREIMLNKGWVEVNEDIENSEVSGEFATRATQKGIDEFPAHEGADGEADDQDIQNSDKENNVVQTTSVFEIEDIKVVKKRATSGNLKYPFDQLEIGQSFFIPATEDRPEPWKSLCGAITVANNRHAVPKFAEDGTTPIMRKKRNSDEVVQAMQLTRKFAITKDTKDGVEGARMGRIDL